MLCSLEIVILFGGGGGVFTLLQIQGGVFMLAGVLGCRLATGAA